MAERTDPGLAATISYGDSCRSRRRRAERQIHINERRGLDSGAWWMKSIFDECDAVETREDLAVFIESLLVAMRSGQFDNDRLESFLDGLAGWTADMHGYFMGRGESCPEQPTWNLVARMLLAASAYE